MNFLKRLFKTKTAIINTLTVTSANGFHLRPIAQFVNEAKKYDAIITLSAKGKTVPATQVTQILSLSLEKGDGFTLTTKGNDAKKSSTELSSFFEDLMHKDKVVEPVKQEIAFYEATALKGQTIAKGVGIAPLIQYSLSENLDKSKQGRISVQEAIELTQAELTAYYERNKTQDSSQIFLAQKELLSSDTFQIDFSSIDEFKSTVHREMIKLQDTKFQSRIADYQDLQKRVLQHLGIFSELQLPAFPYILLAKELLPSEIEKLSKTPIRGVVLQGGTQTSHAAILLRSAAIPSVIIHEEIEVSRNVILDASTGSLILKPTKQDLEEANIKHQAFIKLSDMSFEKRFEGTQTKDGKSVQLLANITDLTTAKEAKSLGAEGIGLLRTEFLFTHVKPDVKEQILAYQEIFKLFSEVTVRTLDIGGDKSLPYIEIEKEENPFLGIRGIRFSLKEKTLFTEQLLAIGMASTYALNTKVKIMFPMVSNMEEFIEAKAMALEIYKENDIEHKNIEFGIMLEVPSVIFALKEFDKLVDFYSIGSNDLTQYLFAIERTHPSLNVDTASPMLMSALKYIRENSTKPISICGELAAAEEVTKELIEMNYTSLSVSSKLIPSLKERIRSV
jgi:phosphotransferase system HPr (HPr) family protein